MNVWPVIVREVREQARQRFTYTLRVLGVAAALAAVGLAMLNPGFSPSEGNHVFVVIHQVLLCSIWALVPLGAADCISRERREGTLGLLFLTPLGARDIVSAKLLAHALRALTLWLACLPVLLIPFMMGGLAWQSVAFSCAINLCSIALALGVTVVASSLCRDWRRALALTTTFAVVGLATFVTTLLTALVFAILWCAAGFDWLKLLDEFPPFEEFPQAGLMAISGAQNSWEDFAANLSPREQHWAFAALALVCVLSVLAALALVLLAARNIRRRWRDEPPSPRVEKIERVFCTPVVWQSFLRRWMRWKLERNPIGWLEQRTWSGRLVMWTWLAVLVAFYSTMFTSERIFLRGFQWWQMMLAWFLMVSMAATAAGSLRRERETGVLELLLVAPLSHWQIISGRVRGIWGQFAPAAALLMGTWVLVATFEPYVSVWEGVWFLMAFLAMPVIGLYYSLAKAHFISSLLWTLLMGWFFPTLLVNPRAILWVLWLYRFRVPFGPGVQFEPVLQGAIFGGVQIVLALAFARLLRRNLEQRRFALERKPV